MLAGTAHPFDEKRFRTFMERDYDRSGGYLNATNHGVLVADNKWQGRLPEIRAPLLVIHGTVDPVFPIEHGEALAREVKDAKLVRLEGSGHELHMLDWDTIISAITAHTRAR